MKAASVLAGTFLIVSFAHALHHAEALSPPAVCGASVDFEPNSAALSASAVKELNEFVMRCESYQRTVFVSGYPDDREESPRGASLAEARAQAVRNYLLSTGIFPKAVRVSFDYGVVLPSTSTLRRAVVTAP